MTDERPNFDLIIGGIKEMLEAEGIEVKDEDIIKAKEEFVSMEDESDAEIPLIISVATEIYKQHLSKLTLSQRYVVIKLLDGIIENVREKRRDQTD